VETDSSETTTGVEVADSSLNHVNNIVGTIPMPIPGTTTTFQDPIATRMEDAVVVAKTEAPTTTAKWQEVRPAIAELQLSTKAAALEDSMVAVVVAQDASTTTTTDLSIRPINNISSARTFMWQKNLNQTVLLLMNTNRKFHRSQKNHNSKRKQKCWNK